MRYFLSKKIPPLHRVLLVESGTRGVLNRLIPVLYERLDPNLELDLITCYPGEPQGLRGRVYRVADYADGKSRRRLMAELSGKKYSLVGIVCSGEPIMTKWKWAVAARVPAKVFAINENSDFFFLDRGNLRPIWQLAKLRSGLSGTASLPALGRLAALPFSLIYLLIFAGFAHLRRALRRA